LYASSDEESEQEGVISDEEVVIPNPKRKIMNDDEDLAEEATELDDDESIPQDDISQEDENTNDDVHDNQEDSHISYTDEIDTPAEEQEGSGDDNDESADDNADEDEDAPFSVSVDVDEDDEEEQTEEVDDPQEDASDPEDRIPLEEVAEGKPKWKAPLDYAKLKEKKEQKGVCFLSQPPSDWQNEHRLEEYFEEYGKVGRIKPSYQVKGKKKYLLGYYIEFERKSVAKRIALTLNMQPISTSDSRLFQIKFVPSFEFSELEESDARDKLKKKLLIAEARKELRQVEMYQGYAKWSQRVKRKSGKGESFTPIKDIHIPQRSFKRYERDDDTHLNFLPIFKKKKHE
jgi:hypothetical protein